MAQAAAARTRVCVVTGANRGIGLATASAVARIPGWRAVLVARTAEKAATAAAGLRPPPGPENDGVRACPVGLEAGDARSREEFVAALRELEPTVDAFVNNAAYLSLEWNKEVFDESMQANVVGPLDLTQRIVNAYAGSGAKADKDTRKLRCVQVSSEYGVFGGLSPHYRTLLDAEASWQRIADGSSEAMAYAENDAMGGFTPGAYRLSKALLNRATQLMAQDYRDRAVLVNVCPGWVDTRMGRAVGRQPPRTTDQGAASVLAAAVFDGEDVHGGFFRDGDVLDMVDGTGYCLFPTPTATRTKTK